MLPEVALFMKEVGGGGMNCRNGRCGQIQTGGGWR